MEEALKDCSRNAYHFGYEIEEVSFRALSKHPEKRT